MGPPLSQNAELAQVIAELKAHSQEMAALNQDMIPKCRAAA